MTFWKLGTWLKGMEYAQLTCVLVPDDTTNLAQTTWTPIVDAQELYQLLTTEGQLHYQQAAETPLVKGPFTEKLGPFDDNEYCNAILHRNFNTNNIANISEVSDILSGMQYLDPHTLTPEFNAMITEDEFFQAVYHTCE